MKQAPTTEVKQVFLNTPQKTISEEESIQYFDEVVLSIAIIQEKINKSRSLSMKSSNALGVGDMDAIYSTQIEVVGNLSGLTTKINSIVPRFNKYVMSDNILISEHAKIMVLVLNNLKDKYTYLQELESSFLYLKTDQDFQNYIFLSATHGPKVDQALKDLIEPIMALKLVLISSDNSKNVNEKMTKLALETINKNFDLKKIDNIGAGSFAIDTGIGLLKNLLKGE